MLRPWATSKDISSPLCVDLRFTLQGSYSGLSKTPQLLFSGYPCRNIKCGSRMALSPCFSDHKDVVATTDIYPKATADLEKNALVKRTESLEKDVAAANEATTKAKWRQ